MAKTPSDQLSKIDGNTFSAADVLALTDASVQYGPTADRPTGSRRHDGKLYFDTDVRQLLCWDGANSVWSVVSLAGQWMSWTPTITQSGSVAATVGRASYTRAGRMITANFTLVCGGAGTSGNAVIISLPVAAAASTVNEFVGRGKIYVVSLGSEYYGDVVLHSSTACKLHLHADGTGSYYAGISGSVWSQALASNDLVTGQIIYEAAS